MSKFLIFIYILHCLYSPLIDLISEFLLVSSDNSLALHVKRKKDATLELKFSLLQPGAVARTYSTREHTFTSATVLQGDSQHRHHLKYSKTSRLPCENSPAAARLVFSRPESRQTVKTISTRQLSLSLILSLFSFSVHSFLCSELPEEGRGGCIRFWLLGDVPRIPIRLPAT